MLNFLYRQRRHAALQVGLAVLLASITWAIDPDFVERFHRSWILYASIAIIILILVFVWQLVTAFLIPEFRFIAAIMLAIQLVLASASLIIPTIFVSIPLLHPLTFLALLVLSIRFLCGSGDRISFGRKTITRTCTLKIEASPQEIFEAFLFTSERHDVIYPGVRTLTDPKIPNKEIVVYPDKSGQAYQIGIVTNEESDAPNYFKLRFEPFHQTTRSNGLSGTFECQISQQSNERQLVTLKETREDVPVNRRFVWYLDNEFADRMASAKAGIENRRDWSFFKNLFASR